MSSYPDIYTGPPRAHEPSPLRVLVQTLTHLVPSEGWFPDNPWFDKSISMVNRICEYHWKCRIEPGIRWYTYDADFGYTNRLCFFLVDCGKADNDADVPILCYKWTGDSFEPMPKLLQSADVQEQLKSHPFTPEPGKVRKRPPIPESVRGWLRSDGKIPAHELEYMKDHPEDMDWLRRKVRPRFWANFVRQMEAQFPEDDSLRQRLSTVKEYVGKGDIKAESGKENPSIEQEAGNQSNTATSSIGQDLEEERDHDDK